MLPFGDSEFKKPVVQTAAYIESQIDAWVAGHNMLVAAKEAAKANQQHGG